MTTRTISMCEDCERRLLLIAPHIMAGVFPSNRNGQWVHLDEHDKPNANIDLLDHDAVPADEGHEEDA